MDIKLPTKRTEKMEEINKECAQNEKELSFLRRKLSAKEIKERTLIVNISLGTPEYDIRQAPLSVSIKNIDGKNIYTQIITPRKKDKFDK